MKKVTTDISSFLNVEKVKVKEAKSESSIESQINKLMKKASHEALLKHPILKEYYKRIETTTFKENKKSKQHTLEDINDYVVVIPKANLEANGKKFDGFKIGRLSTYLEGTNTRVTHYYKENGKTFFNSESKIVEQA